MVSVRVVVPPGDKSKPTIEPVDVYAVVFPETLVSGLPSVHVYRLRRRYSYPLRRLRVDHGVVSDLRWYAAYDRNWCWSKVPNEPSRRAESGKTLRSGRSGQRSIQRLRGCALRTITQMMIRQPTD